MHTTTEVKKEYAAPKIISIKLDNEISLAMESDAPAGPNEGQNKTPEYFNNDPYKQKA